MILKKWFKTSLLKGILGFLPLALLSSGSDGALLWGIRSFMDLFSKKSILNLREWFILMIGLLILRFTLSHLKIKKIEYWIYSTSTSLKKIIFRKLRNLSPLFSHLDNYNEKIESIYQSTQIVEKNGVIFLQSIQAILQLVVFIPVLIYISPSLTLFLFVVILPFVTFFQKKIQKMGPIEDEILLKKSAFRNQYDKDLHLFKLWSYPKERVKLSSQLQQSSLSLNQEILKFSIRKKNLSLIMETICIVAMIFVLAFCAILIQNHLMDSDGLILFCSAVLLCYKPIKECSKAIPDLRTLISACHFLIDFEKMNEKKIQSLYHPNSIIIKNGAFSYKNNNPVFKNLNIQWEISKPILLRGTNGIGKSTLLKLIANLEEWEMGEMFHPLKAKYNGIFFLSQNIELPPREYLIDLLQTNDSNLNEFIIVSNIQKLLDKEKISGGEQAKIGLLWALASDSKVLLLDEPLSAIALSDREKILNTFIKICNLKNKWFIFSTHDKIQESIEKKFNVVNLNEEYL